MLFLFVAFVSYIANAYKEGKAIPYKEGKVIPYSLKDGNSMDFQFDLKHSNLILYVRPPIQDDERKIIKEGSKDIQSGILNFKINGKDNIDWSNEVSEYYQSALFINFQAEQQVIMTCTIGPCNGTITGYSQEGDIIQEEEKEFEIYRVFLFKMNMPEDVDRLIGYVKILNDAENVKAEVFNAEGEISYDEVSMLMAIERTSHNKGMLYGVISGKSRLKKRFTVSAKIQTYSSFKSISIRDQVEDYLLQGKVNTYKLQIPNDFNILSIMITGKVIPRVLVNLDDKPSSLKQYNYDSETDMSAFGNEFQILIHKKNIKKYIYLGLTGIIGQYQLKFVNIEGVPLIHDNQVIFGLSDTNYVHTLQLEVPELDINIFGFNLNQGNIVLDICESEQNCENTEDNQVEKKENRFKQLFNNKCTKKSTNGLCLYDIKIKETESNQAFMLAIHTSISEAKLKVNVPFTNFIIEEEVQQFIVKYDKKDGDIALIFTVSTTNVMYMISKDPKCYPVKEECAKYFGGADDIVVLRGKQLNVAQFYVAIIGRQTNYYTFTMQSRNSEIIAIQKLKEGDTQRGVLIPARPDEQIAYFQIEINFDSKDPDIQISEDTINPIIEFNLHGPKYKLALLVNAGKQLPSVDEFDIGSLNNYLAIAPTDKEYLRKGVFSIAVQFLIHENYDEIDEHTKIHFSLTYSTSRTIKNLKIGEQYIDQLGPQSRKLYSFNHLLSNENIYITKNEFKGSISISVSADAQRKADEFVLEMPQHTSTLILDPENLNKLCEVKENDDNDNDDQEDQIDSILDMLRPITCEVYVQINNHNSEISSFSLNVWSQQFPIELHEGQASSFNLENLLKPIKLYYNLVSYTNDVQLLISSLHGYTNYTLKILNNKDDEIQSLFFQEEWKTYHSKSISTSAFNECQPYCQIYIELQGQPDTGYLESERLVEYNDEVDIVISQQFMEIFDGSPIQVTINEPRQFIFSSLDKIPNDSRLKIILHEVFGKGYICLSFSDDTNLRMPQLKQMICDYAIEGNAIELTKSQIQEILDNENLKENPIMIIELSNRKNSELGKFILTVETENLVDNHQMQLGTPVRMKLDVSETVIYQFFNFQSESLHIKFISIAGVAEISVSRCLDDSQNQCVKEDLFSDKIVAGQSYSHYTILNNSEQYCSYCSYFFNFTTFGVKLDALFTVTTDTNFVQLSQGITFTDYLEAKNDVNLYHFSFDTSYQIEVTIKEYDGETNTYLSFNTIIGDNESKLGPFNKIKQQKLLNQTDITYYECIIPPRPHLEQNQEEYNITPYNHPNHTLAGHFNEDDIYIFVSNQNNQPANYSITVTQAQSGSGALLQDGVIQTFSLSKAAPEGIFYYNHAYTTIPLLILKLYLQGVQQLIPLESYVQVYVKNSTSDDYILLPQVSQYHDQLMFKLPQEIGLITIKIVSLLSIKENSNMIQYYFDKTGQPVKYPGSQSYQFTYNFIQRINLEVSVNSKDIYLLPTEAFMTDTVTPNSAKYYETFFSTEGKLGLQLSSCSGDLNLRISQSYNDFSRGEFQTTKIIPSSSSNDIILTVDPGPLYLKIDMDNQNSDKAVYKINTKFYRNNQQHPFGFLLPGSDGNIEYNMDSKDPDTISISFKPLKCISCDQKLLANSQVAYKISWGGTQDYAKLIGLCSYAQYESLKESNNYLHGSATVSDFNLEKQDQIKFNIDASKQSDNDKLYITVVGRVLSFNGQSVGDFEVYYRIIEINMPKNAYYMYKHRYTEFVLVLSVLAVFIFSILCCLCYFYRKVRKLRNDKLNLQLKNKMHEAQKNKDKDNYGQLEDEKDEENQDDPQPQQLQG